MDLKMASFIQWLLLGFSKKTLSKDPFFAFSAMVWMKQQQAHGAIGDTTILLFIVRNADNNQGQHDPIKPPECGSKIESAVLGLHVRTIVMNSTKN